MEFSEFLRSEEEEEDNDDDVVFSLKMEEDDDTGLRNIFFQNFDGKKKGIIL